MDAASSNVQTIRRKHKHKALGGLDTADLWLSTGGLERKLVRAASDRPANEMRGERERSLATCQCDRLRNDRATWPELAARIRGNPEA